MQVIQNLTSTHTIDNIDSVMFIKPEKKRMTLVKLDFVNVSVSILYTI